MKTTNDMKNTLERNRRLNDTEECINELEDRAREITATVQIEKKRIKRNEDSVRDLWDNVKHTSISISERKGRRKYPKS